MKIFKVPHEGVISIEACSGGQQTHVPQNYGYVNIDVERIIYYRDYSELLGLIRVSTGVDIILNREWYDKITKYLESYFS